ncbi:MAG: sortase [Betaproteobacteria bacterium]|nr:sortase [Betaproteobacteria bacterium]
MSPYGDVALGVECALPDEVPEPGDRPSGPHWITWIAAPLLLAGAIQFGPGLYALARQAITQIFLERAWHSSRGADRLTAPWPWAQARPLARLGVPALGIDRLVLAGSQRPPAIPAPFHKEGTPAPGRPGNSVIDDPQGSALDFLRRLKQGDLLSIERTDRGTVDYRVTDIEVLDRRDVWVMKNEGPTRLTLIGCYPFAGSCSDHSLRYVVIARALPSTQRAAR